MKNNLLALRLRSILLTLFALTALVARADGDPYDEKEYADAVKLQHKLYEGADSEDWLERTVTRCDSLYEVGKRQKNYMVMAEGLYLKSYVYIHNDEYIDKMQKCMYEAMHLMKQHNHMSVYFLYYMQYCEWLGKVDDKVLETKAFIAETEEYEGMHEFTASGYELLGNVYSESMCDYIQANEMYQKAYALMKKYPELSTALLDLPLYMGVNYANLGFTDKAYEQASFFKHKNKNIPKGSPNEYVLKRTELIMAYACNDKKQIEGLYRDLLENPIWSQISAGEMAWINMMYYTTVGRFVDAENVIPQLMQNDAECVNNYVYIRRMYEKWGRYDKALLYADSCKNFSDSVRRVSEAKEFMSLDSRMMQITMDGEAERSRSKLMLTTLVSGAIVFFVVVAMLYIMLSRRKRHARQLQEKNDELTEARDEAVKAGEMKSEFIRNMSHELRTPIHQLDGFATILADSGMELDADSIKEITQSINSASSALTGAIDNVIYLSALDSDSRKPEMEDVMLAGVIDSAVSSMGRIDKPITVVKQIDLPEGYTLLTNERMLMRALGCLLNNAVKFTTEGTITIAASVVDDQLTISVADTGCGIAKGREEDIFERFVKIDSFIPGIGLGLSICKATALRLGFDVFVDTTYTGGARMVMKKGS